MILVISDPADGHVPPVVAELSRRGEECVVYDPATYPDGSALTIEGTPDGVRAFLGFDGSCWQLSEATSVWYRRPGDFKLSDRLLAVEDEWLRNECRHLFRGVYGSGILHNWVSDPDAIRRASVKVTQLTLAMEMGFLVPRFVVTNDVDRASAFLASCRAGAIVKVLADPGILYPRQAGSIYTHLLSEQDLDEVDAVRHGPAFFQEFIEKALDVRVTVVGSRPFAVGIHSQRLEESRVDFRRAKIYTLPHTVVSLPADVEALCVDLVRRLGLRFGAIDLVFTPDGRYVFLEINPNGQWYWLEEITGVPLTAAMCDLLTGTV